MKKLLTLFAVGMIALSSGIARGDLMPALSNSYSSDGDAYLLYHTFNALFGSGSGMYMGSNNELLAQDNNYVKNFNNQGALQVTAPRIYVVSGVHADEDDFKVWGTNPNNMSEQLFSYYNFPNIDPTNTSVLRDWLNRPLQLGPGVDMSNYSGPLNFSVSNLAGNGGVFNSNVIDYQNRVGYGSNLSLDKSGVNYFLYWDVTNLMKLAYPDLDFDYTNAYLIAYEDRAMSGPKQTDYDYNDGVFLVFSNDGSGPGPQPGVPEPATLLLWTLGSMGFAGSSWTRKRRMMKLAKS